MVISVFLLCLLIKVRELKDDVRKQKELNQLERVQDYPIANNQHPYPAETATELGGPHLEAIKVQAKMGGWDIEPHEVGLFLFTLN